MTTGRRPASHILMRVVAALVAFTGVGMAALGVAMFWGPLRQVLAAPVVVAVGVMACIAGRGLWLTVDRVVRVRD